MLVYSNLLHAEHLVHLGPLGVGLHHELLFPLSNSHFVLHPLNHLESSLHLLACTLVVFIHIACTSLLFLLFFIIIKTQSTIGLGRLSEELLKLFLVVEVLFVHA